MKEIFFGMSPRDTVVVGEDGRAGIVASALRTASQPARVLSHELALRSPGRTAGALAVMLWPPGTQPAVEAEHFADGEGAVHAWWGAESAEVGPYVVRGAGPCLACLSARPRSAAFAGHDATVAAWVAATVALQVRALARLRGTDLIGRSLSLRAGTPRVEPLDWKRRDGCAVPGCGGYGYSPMTARSG